jgi:hypothetical protein
VFVIGYFIEATLWHFLCVETKGKTLEVSAVCEADGFIELLIDRNLMTSSIKNVRRRHHNFLERH